MLNKVSCPLFCLLLSTLLQSKVTGKSSSHEKDGPLSLESAACEIPYDSDRKEKFKMVIGKSKNDGPDSTPKSSQQQSGVGVDAAAAAAILQAATRRGIRNPNLCFPSRSSMNGSSEVGQVSSLGSLPTSLPHSVNQKSDQSRERTSKENVMTGPPEAAGETESCDAHLTREQKLKAERLKRARMFVAMIKNGPAPPKTEPSRGVSVEPQIFNAFGADASEDILAAKERDGIAAPLEFETSAKIEYSGKKLSADEYNERMSRRKYRSKTSVNEDAEDFVDDAEVVHSRLRKKHRSRRSSSEDDEKVEQERVNKHSRKKHRLHHSSHDSSHRDELEDDERDQNYFRKQHRSHRSAHEEDERDENEHDQRHSRKKHRSHRSSHHCRDGHKHRKISSSSRDKESRHQHKREFSSGEEEKLDSVRSDKLRKGSQSDREELEEGEISSKVSDQSRGSVGFGGANREASVDRSVHGGVAKRREASVDMSSSHREPSEPAEVSDDLRAKIRAMLMGTL